MEAASSVRCFAARTVVGRAGDRRTEPRQLGKSYRRHPPTPLLHSPCRCSLSPSLLVSPSPCLPLSVSPCLSSLWSPGTCSCMGSCDVARCRSEDERRTAIGYRRLAPEDREPRASQGGSMNELQRTGQTDITGMAAGSTLRRPPGTWRCSRASARARPAPKNRLPLHYHRHYRLRPAAVFSRPCPLGLLYPCRLRTPELRGGPVQGDGHGAIRRPGCLTGLADARCHPEAPRVRAGLPGVGGAEGSCICRRKDAASTTGIARTSPGSLRTN